MPNPPISTPNPTIPMPFPVSFSLAYSIAGAYLSLHFLHCLRNTARIPWTMSLLRVRRTLDPTNRPSRRRDSRYWCFFVGSWDLVTRGLGRLNLSDWLNLLRWLPGFEVSQINSKGEQSMGFALFSTPQHAVAAKNALQDMVFDAETKCTIHAEMAKKNHFVKRGVYLHEMLPLVTSSTQQTALQVFVQKPLQRCNLGGEG